MKLLNLSWLSKITPRLRADAVALIVEPPVDKMKSPTIDVSLGLPMSSSSVLALFNFRKLDDIQALISARHASSFDIAAAASLGAKDR
jgi:hypothetical protein